MGTDPSSVVEIDIKTTEYPGQATVVEFHIIHVDDDTRAKVAAGIIEFVKTLND